jgi:type VI secretion system protein ImpF
MRGDQDESKQGARALLFDRLIDEAPEQPFEVTPFRHYTLPNLRASVVNEVARLLNSRAPVSEGERGPLFGTTLTFGIADYAVATIASTDERNALCREIAAVIEAFEPRLKNVRVQFVKVDSSRQALSFIVDATLSALPIVEQFSFPVQVGGEGE